MLPFFLVNISMQKTKDIDALAPEILMIKESYNLIRQEPVILIGR